MLFPGKEELKRLREEYPAGCRVRLVKMDDIQAPPEGTKGTVRCVDDAGSVSVLWDTGNRLSAVYQEDIIEKI